MTEYHDALFKHVAQHAKLNKAQRRALTEMSKGYALRETMYEYWYIADRCITEHVAQSLIEGLFVKQDRYSERGRRYSINEMGRAAISDANDVSQP